MGFKDLFTKVHLPALMMLAIGYVCNVIGWILGRKMRVSPFTVRRVSSFTTSLHMGNSASGFGDESDYNACGRFHACGSPARRA